MPWAMALRRMWTSGSVSPSRMARSSSVSAPRTTSSTCLPVSAARSRTARGSGATIDDSGSVRMPIAAPLRSVEQALAGVELVGERPVAGVRAELVLEAPAVEDGLAHEVEQRVDLLGRHADRAALARRRRRRPPACAASTAGPLPAPCAAVSSAISATFGSPSPATCGAARPRRAGGARRAPAAACPAGARRRAAPP